MALKNKKLKDFFIFFRKNKFLFLFLFIGLATFSIVLYKNLLLKNEFAYAKVLVNYPESYYSKTTIWIANSLKKGDVEYGLLNQPEAKILNVKYYPVINSTDNNQFNIYLDLKLKVNHDSRTNEFSFQRSKIAVGSPISLSFPNSHISGTILYLNKNPIEVKYIEKTVYFVLVSGYKKSIPYFYDSINIGDKYFDGNDTIFQITDKRLEKNVFAVVNNFTNQVSEGETDTTQDIILITKIKLRQEANQLIFGNDQNVKIGNKLNLSTDNGLSINDFVISKIE